MAKGGWRELCLGNATHMEQRWFLMPSRCLRRDAETWKNKQSWGFISYYWWDFFPPHRLCIFLCRLLCREEMTCATHRGFFWCCCLGLHILATHDVITPFTEMANLPPLTIDNYGIIISFVLQREPSRRAVIYLGAQQEVAGRLQSSVTVARRYLKAPAGVRKVQIRGAVPWPQGTYDKATIEFKRRNYEMKWGKSGSSLSYFL